MITIEQIQKLDQKVQAAVNRISTLTSENASLLDKLSEYEKRIGELEVLIERFKKDQTEIENGIIRALEQLDHLEDSLNEPENEVDTPKETPEDESDEETEEAASEEPNVEQKDEEELDIF